MTVPLFTLRAIARKLDLPESTVRYYRDVFAPFVPTNGRGRRRRYPAEALPLFRLIADGFAENRTRDQIAAVLAEQTGGDLPAPVALPPVVRHAAWTRTDDDSSRELLAIVLDGERERREVTWQMAREIVRLGEAIERQQVVLGELAGQIQGRADRTLPPPPAEPPPGSDNGTGLDEELQSLREELDRERELVDRLRRSKLKMEQRAAEAEEALAEANEQDTRGIFRRGRMKRDS